MGLGRFLTAVFFLLASFLPAKAADLIIHGGPIYTGTDWPRVVEAVVVSDGKISFVGSSQEAIGQAETDTRIIDLDGAALYPGFVDSHAHFRGIGERELTLNLDHVGSISELVQSVKDYRAANPSLKVLTGRGWIETHFPEGRFPNRQDIDAAVADIPVLLRRADGHALLANSKALELAGISDSTVDPDGGMIRRDGSGVATGILVDKAQALVSSLVSAPDAAARQHAYKTADRLYASRGWTGVHNMSVAWSDVALLETMSKEETIHLRLYNAVDIGQAEKLLESGPRKSGNDRIVTRAVKIYADGALGSRGAALLAPYSDDPGNEGLLVTDLETLDDQLKAAKDAGLQACTHAIGDRGNREVLDAYANNLKGLDDPRWRIEHAQIINPKDHYAFADMGVIASMQPSHAISDLHFAPARLGSERLHGAYAWASLIKTGAVITGGSDAPVEAGDPLIEFYAAVERRSLKGFSDDNWRREERVSRMDALKMFTSNPAFASFAEDQLGTIEVGKSADFSGFSKDIMTVEPKEILQARAVLTVIEGKVVFEVKH